MSERTNNDDKYSTSQYVIPDYIVALRQYTVLPHRLSDYHQVLDLLTSIQSNNHVKYPRLLKGVNNDHLIMF